MQLQKPSSSRKRQRDSKRGNTISCHLQTVTGRKRRRTCDVAAAAAAADAIVFAVELDAPTADAEVDVEDAVELEVVVLEVLEEDVVEVVESVVEVGVADVAGAALVAGSVHQHCEMTRE